MQLSFSKMHGLGNDFVVVDAATQPVAISTEIVRRLADRHTGIGFDQLLLVEAPRDSNIDFDYRIFNADGGEVEQCGNGARCFGRFVRDQGLTNKDRLRVGTAGGVIGIELGEDEQVSVEMGEPQFDPIKIPFLADQQADHYTIQLADTELEIGAVSIGNPHAVTWVDDIETAPVAQLGPILEHHDRFPNRVNAGFAQRINASTIRLRVFERGVGETLACGTGACAAVAVGRQQGLLSERVRVRLTGGELLIRWPGPGSSLWLTGPTAHVYDGVVAL